jgi:hypothetical protein
VSHSIETRGHRAFKASAMPLRVRSTSRLDLENNRLEGGGMHPGIDAVPPPDGVCPQQCFCVCPLIFLFANRHKCCYNSINDG